MKNFNEFIKPKVKKVVKPKHDYRKPPTKIPKDYNPYEDICRIFPAYVAQNYIYFELITAPKLKPKEGYVKKIKEKINCLKAKFSV